MDSYARLQQSLEQSRADAEMTQTSLARAMNAKQGFVSEILSGKKRMGSKSLGRVLRVFPHLRPLVIAVLAERGN